MLLILLMPLALLAQEQILIGFSPSVKYVQPGDNFDLECNSDSAASIKVCQNAKWILENTFRRCTVANQESQNLFIIINPFPYIYY